MLGDLVMQDTGVHIMVVGTNATIRNGLVGGRRMAKFWDDDIQQNSYI